MSAPPRREWWRLGAETIWLPTSGEMADLDRWATESGAIPERALVEAAGREVAHAVQLRWPEGPVVALAGSGHNGADALVAVRCLRAWGRSVRAVACGGRPPEPDVLQGWDVPLRERGELGGALEGAAVLLDGILGTGLSGPPREPQAGVIRRANESGVPILAVDGPSGADFTTGRVPGEAIRAALTVALGWPKLGLLRFPARERCGDLIAVEIGFPPPPEPPGARAITAPWVRRLLARRPPDAHKGRAGYLALVAGRRGMAGASVLAARSAARGGAGIVRVVGDPANRVIVQTSVPEAIFVPWDEEREVSASVEWAHAVAVGPGLGRGTGPRKLVGDVLARRGERPVLLDADALNVWEGEAQELADALEGHALVTPHPGELARLLDVPVEEIVEDPPARAREAAERLGCTVLLKGSPSVVARAGEPLRVSTAYGPALAAGGTGDVLTGLCGAYLAAGMDPLDAATAALLVSGRAAVSAPEAVGHVAGDIPDRIPKVRRALDVLSPSGWGGVVFASPAIRGA